VRLLIFKVLPVLCLCSLVQLSWADPIVIAHRGASGYLPEHTLAAYQLAIEQGADYIEPDLVITRDGVLVARHEHYLSLTTDVASHPEFADRRRKLGDKEDWFSEDFTLAEIRTLRTRQAFPGRDTSHDGRYRIPTLVEVLQLVQYENQKRDRQIGIYPETKVPGHFEALGYDFAGLLLRTLARYGWDREGAPIYIQSFEPDILKALESETRLPLVQLVSAVRTPAGIASNIPLQELATYADGVGAMKWLLLNRQGEDSGFVKAAHELGLKVHIWTLRDDAFRKEAFATAAEEIDTFLGLGIDGFFTDFPDTGVAARNRLPSRRSDKPSE